MAIRPGPRTALARYLSSSTGNRGLYESPRVVEVLPDTLREGARFM